MLLTDNLVAHCLRFYVVHSVIGRTFW